MILSFVATSVSHPVGGAIAVYEFANGMCRRGHEVHLLHRPFPQPGWPIPALEDMTWCRFEEGIVHHRSDPFDVGDLPDADFVFSNEPGLAARQGLPLIFVQGTMMGRVAQEARMQQPCPKLCVAGWLVELGRSIGVPPDELVHLPPGIDPGKYRVKVPITSRPVQVAMLHHTHPLKGTFAGLKALETARVAVPDLEAVLFGTYEPTVPMPDWVTFLYSPPQDVIVDVVYNNSRVYLSPSLEEGFGLTALEAMASGCALVTTANGGSADYAVHGETALVCEPSDIDTMSRHIVSLLSDDELRGRVATSGRQLAERSTWDASAARLEAVLEQYGADPVRFGRPAF